MKIGIMGGTFDPIHNGHLMLGHAAYETFSLDQIWFMPNGNPPHKRGKNITDDKIRCDMIKKAISLGVSKLNVNTECQLAFAAATRKYVEEGKDLQGKGFDPRKLLAPGFEAIKATVKEKMELFGSVNKA